MATHETLYTEPEPYKVPRIRAPWTLKAESYVLFLKLKTLPKGVYSPLEETWADEGLGTFTGGVGMVMIVRYSDTPVGPYDELILMPGTFSVPQPSREPLKIPKNAQRVSRIYVSQRTTAYHGRLNWNIPKHLARFVFSAPRTLKGFHPPSSLTVRVFAPGTIEGDGVPPFFACTLAPWTWAPALPISTRYLPNNLVIVQPPIPESTDHQAAAKEVLAGPNINPYDLDPAKELSLYVGTNRWCAFSIAARVSRARGCWAEVKATTGEGDKEKTWFPSDLKTWRVGSWCEEVEWTIEKPLEWEL